MPLLRPRSSTTRTIFHISANPVRARIEGVEFLGPYHRAILRANGFDLPFTADLSAHAQAEMKAGKSVDDAFASFKIDKYAGYKNERVKAAIQAVYDELKK